MPTDHAHDVPQLNSFLRSELSAVETYEQAKLELAHDPDVTRTLAVCSASHRFCVELIRREVRRLGGTPSIVSGIWGGFATLLEGAGGAGRVVGRRATVVALDRGEDYCHQDYEYGLEALSPQTQNFVQREVIPRQGHVHDLVRRLRQRLSTPLAVQGPSRQRANSTATA